MKRRRRRLSSAVGARNPPVWILIERRRPDLAIEAPRIARADIASPAPRRCRRSYLSRVPGIAETMVLSHVVLVGMPAACLGGACRDHADQRGRASAQHQKPDRIVAHAHLPFSTTDTARLSAVANSASSSATIGARRFPVRIIVERRRPNRTIDGAGISGAGTARPTRRRRCRADFSRSPGVVETNTCSLLIAHWLIMLADMPAATLGGACRNYGAERDRTDGQRQKPDRMRAHALHPLIPIPPTAVADPRRGRLFMGRRHPFFDQDRRRWEVAMPCSRNFARCPGKHHLPGGATGPRCGVLPLPRNS